MNREERRAEQKLGKRRLKWLDNLGKHDQKVQKVIAELEENFEEDEILDAKLFLADCLTQSGPFSEAHEDDPMEKTCQYYGLEVADGLFIVDVMEQVLTEGGPEGPAIGESAPDNQE